MKQFVTGLFLISMLSIASSTPAISSSFTADLSYEIAHERPTENVIISPVSIKSVLALAYLGTAGNTANEMKTVLGFPTSSKEEIAKEFGKLLEKTKSSETAKLEVANRVYVAAQYSLAPRFNELAAKYFDSAAESVDFSDGTETAKKINAWTEEKTNNKIKDLINPSSLDGSIVAILINAIYFKAKWLYTFPKEDTEKRHFYINETSHVLVDMMTKTAYYRYADLTDLSAIAVELPYNGTDLSMLIILPKKIDGLANLETKLKDVDITKIAEKFQARPIVLRMPKFKIEFGLQLNGVLQKLGLNSMFSAAADFSELLTENNPMEISKVVHRAFIDVTEESTEAAAVTYMIGTSSSSSPQIINNIYVTVDHPFFFAIKDEQNVYFTGHVVKF